MKQNTIVNGDCMDVMAKMPDSCVDLVLTDIPYGVCNKTDQVDNPIRTVHKQNADEITFDLEEFVSDVIRICKGSIYIFCGTEQVSDIRRKLIDAGLTTRLLIWEKTNPSPMNGQHVWLSGVECCVFGKKTGATFNGFCRNTVLRYPCGSSKLHPTEKPIKMIQELVEISSNPGDLVFDPCMGSGTTAVAAKNTQRKYFGCELSPEYYRIAIDRIGNVCPLFDAMGLD